MLLFVFHLIIYLGNTTEPSCIACIVTSFGVKILKNSKNSGSTDTGIVVFKYSISK